MDLLVGNETVVATATAAAAATTAATTVEELRQLLDDTRREQAVLAINSRAIVIFFMQCGFAFLEAGSVRSGLLCSATNIPTVTMSGCLHLGPGLYFDKSA
jgi:hypothetical protein